ncbi:putative ENTH/ANTH/VHS superfamily protein [Tripterygium wilfordii]|uniref:Putative ENTH/ANTH/VHS superfamily protein n=1 Tax=Tripterygium wilfordii TaxID=458696 RepID=A0A7J7CVT8_TRIWF|nr:putative clathrin assembly protein At4g40080 [Tripterygium wilfordii]KAF5738016.1 putative ENTH/ANTH/VHS superfamily protein [Tripterygium wilfordii]
MGRITNLREFIGIIKDKASQSKAAVLSNPKNITLRLAILRATTHDPFNPPNQKHLNTLLSYGHSSRATAAAAIEALMDRLQTTRDSSVALKCLITVHHIIKHGSFILQDQLSVYPSAGGRNYLKLSNFRDHTSPLTWELSSWVRWYALYLEHLLSTSRILGFFLCSTSSTIEKDKEEEKVSSLTNTDLLRELNSLVSLLEEICKRPELLHIHGNKLVDEVMGLVGEDYLSSINEVWVRVNEVSQRLSCLSFGESVELACGLKRLEDCKEKLFVLSTRKKALIETLWVLIVEMKDGLSRACVEDRRLVVMGTRDRVSKSARFGDRVVSYGDSVSLASGKFGFSNRFMFSIQESVQSCA